MAFIVHAAGTQSLLVDFGRARTRSLGMPVAGAADRAALALANALVGNSPAAVGLEFALAGPTLEATAEHACVVFGANFGIHVDERRQPVAKTFNIRSGQVLTISTAEAGLRAYLCVPGGFDSPEVLGSRSALEPVRPGLDLACTPSQIRGRFWRPDDLPASDPLVLRVIPGAHAGQFPKEAWVKQEFVVTAESNRMGVRLQAEPLPKLAAELLSAPVCPGTVQVTHDGQTIVLGVDAQTIGGYPRLAHVISADLDKLGQLAPGNRVRFHCVDLLTAERLRRERERWLHATVLRLQSSLLPV